MFPKKGKSFPHGTKTEQSGVTLTTEIADALRFSLGETHQAVKTVMKWTGAEGRTVKNWFAGTHAPSAIHLIELLRHSNEVLDVCPRRAGRDHLIANRQILEVHYRLRELLALIDVHSDNNQKT